MFYTIVYIALEMAQILLYKGCWQRFGGGCLE